MKEQSMSLRRSVLYMPASNERALAKSPSLACDSIIFDFEDAVGPDEKAAARERLLAFLSGAGRPQRELVIRINALDSEWGRDDLAAACACRPDAILIPKVEGVETLREVDRALAELNAPADLKLWAMMETPRSILNAGAIADYARDPSSRLDCLVVGPNDLARATCMVPGPDRANLLPLLLQVADCLFIVMDNQRRQALHDRFARTLVVQVPRTDRPTRTTAGADGSDQMSTSSSSTGGSRADSR